MNFKEFLVLSEIFIDLPNRDVSHVNLRRRGKDYNYSFKVPVKSEVEVNGRKEEKTEMQEFTVLIERLDKINMFGLEIPINGFFKIDFTGPRRYELTGLAGLAGSLVYNKVLETIKRLFEVEEVNAITFAAYNELMLPRYNAFAKMFLRPNPPRGKGFTEVNPNVYVSRDWIRQNAETELQTKLTSADYKDLLKVGRDRMEILNRLEKDRKLRKAQRPQQYQAREQTFAYMADGKIAYLVKFDPATSQFICLTYDLNEDSFETKPVKDMGMIDWNRQVKQDDITVMLDQLTLEPESHTDAYAKVIGIRSIPNNYWQSSGIEKPDDEHVFDIAQDYNIRVSLGRGR